MDADAYLAIALVGLAGWVVWLFFQRSRKVLELEQQRMATLARLVDKFPSAEGFLAFVESNEGRRLLATTERKTTVHRTVLRFVQMGMVVAAIGLALLWSAGRLKGAADAHSIQQREEWSWWGVSLLGLGGGLIGAAGASFLLGRRFKMLDDSIKTDRTTQ